MLTASLTLGSTSLAFDGTTTDSYGGRWYVVELNYPSEVDDNITLASGRHGGYAGQAWLKPREFELVLAYLGGTATGRALARNNLGKAISKDPSSLSTLTFTDGLTLTTQVRRRGSVLIDRFNASECLLSVGLVSPDPRLYSTTLKSYTMNPLVEQHGITFPVTFPITFPSNTHGEARVVNSGNIETPITVTVTGPQSNPGFINTATGQFVQANLTLSSGDTLVFDSARHIAELNGVYRAVSVSSRWFDIQPGTTTIELLGTGASTTGTAEIYDAYDL